MTLGIALLLIGAILILVEAHVPTLGVLGAPGLLALGVGAVLAVSGLGGGIVLGVIAALLLVAVGIGALALSVGKGLAVRRRRVRAGPEALIGHVGVVKSWGPDATLTGTSGARTGSDLEGRVLVDGALWRARRCWPEDEPVLHAGEPVVVEQVRGLTLRVRRAEEWELTP
jgi:membrane-bound serine protease (ClpP class)